jgi:hypothetical protein
MIGMAGAASRQRPSPGRFGAEYDRTIEATGDRREAERELNARRERRRLFDIRELEPAVQSQYAKQWRAVQARFIEQPTQALREADGMVTGIMRRRGYPVDDFERMAADASVDHPREVEDYRTAHAISEASTRDEAKHRGREAGDPSLPVPVRVAVGTEGLGARRRRGRGGDDRQDGPITCGREVGLCPRS